MPQYSQDELEEAMSRWLGVNDRAERETVRDTCVGAAIDSYIGWTYSYDKVVIDEVKGDSAKVY